MQFLKANTEIKVRIGPFVDVGDGFTPETGVALGTADEAELLKNNGAATTDISGATWAAIASCDGWYDLTLTTSHTDTEGLLTVVVQDDSVCLPVCMHFMVLAEAAFDSMFTAKDTGYMDVNVKAISEDTTASDNLEAALENGTAGYVASDMKYLDGGAQSATDLKDFADAGYDPATNKVQGVVLTDTCTTNTDMIGTNNAALASVCTEGRLSELDAANIPADVDAILTDTDKIGAPVALDSGTATIAGMLTKMADDNGGADFDAGTDSLQEIRDRGDSAWTTGAGGSSSIELLSAEIATVTDQTHFTLATGSDVDDTYNQQLIVLYDDSNSDYPSVRKVKDYTGSTKTVTIDAAPDFTLGADDSVKIFVDKTGNQTYISDQFS